MGLHVKLSYPVYRTVTDSGEVICPPTLDCRRAMNARQSYMSFGEGSATVEYVETLTGHEAQVFEGTDRR